MKIVKLLIGIPTSGKSTWARKQNLPIISCDEIRKEFGTNYDSKLEKLVWGCFYRRISEMKEDFIIDNTNCKLVYINKIKENLNKDLNWEVEIVKFEASLLNSYCRNIKRYIFTKKWIPFKVIHQMKLNYNKLWKK